MLDLEKINGLNMPYYMRFILLLYLIKHAENGITWQLLIEKMTEMLMSPSRLSLLITMALATESRYRKDVNIFDNPGNTADAQMKSKGDVIMVSILPHEELSFQQLEVLLRELDEESLEDEAVIQAVLLEDEEEARVVRTNELLEDRMLKLNMRLKLRRIRRELAEQSKLYAALTDLFEEHIQLGLEPLGKDHFQALCNYLHHHQIDSVSALNQSGDLIDFLKTLFELPDEQLPLENVHSQRYYREQ